MASSPSHARTTADADAICAKIAERLHRDICQVLTATSYLAAVLKKDLQARDATEADQAEEICAGLADASRTLADLLAELQSRAS